MMQVTCQAGSRAIPHKCWGFYRRQLMPVDIFIRRGQKHSQNILTVASSKSAVTTGGK